MQTENTPTPEPVIAPVVEPTPVVEPVPVEPFAPAPPIAPDPAVVPVEYFKETEPALVEEVETEIVEVIGLGHIRIVKGDDPLAPVCLPPPVQKSVVPVAPVVVPAPVVVEEAPNFLPPSVTKT